MTFNMARVMNIPAIRMIKTVKLKGASEGGVYPVTGSLGSASNISELVSVFVSPSAVPLGK